MGSDYEGKRNLNGCSAAGAAGAADSAEAKSSMQVIQSVAFHFLD